MKQNPPFKPLETLFSEAWEKLDDVICDVDPAPSSLPDYDDDLERIVKMAERAIVVAEVLKAIAGERHRNRQVFIEDLQAKAEARMDPEDLYGTRGNSYPKG